MANLNETVQWENGVYQWETTDPAQGGASGIMNTPTRQLANRTAWLKSKIGGFGETATLAINESDYTLSASNLNKLLIVDNSNFGDVEITLPIAAIGNKVAIFYRSTATPSFLTVGGLTVVVGDYVELIYTATGTQLVTTFTGWGCASVEAFARNTPPDGYIACNGAAVSRTTYARLFARIGTTFGAGNGTTTFNVPDLRGEFIRGWDNSRGIDSGRAFGSAQQGTIHAIDSTGTNQLYAAVMTSAFLASADAALVAQRTGLDFDANGATNYPNTTSVYADGDGSGGFNYGVARPRNIALLYCIKF